MSRFNTKNNFLFVLNKLLSNNQEKMDVEEDPLDEEDNAILVLLALSLVMSIVIPFLLVISPTIVADGPLIMSLLLLIIAGLLLSLNDMRFLLSTFLASTTGMCNTLSILRVR